MKNYIFLFFLFPLLQNSYAQETFVDSARQIIDRHKGDATEVNALAILGNSEIPDAINYGRQGLQLAQEISYKRGEADCNLVIASAYGQLGSSLQSIQYALNALSIYEELKDHVGIASAHLVIQGNYREVEDFNKALAHEFKGEEVAESKNVTGTFIFQGHRLAPLFLAETGQTYVLKGQLDSAQVYVQRAIEQNELFNGATWYFPIYLLATIQQMKGNHVASLENYRIAKGLAIMNHHFIDTLQIYSGVSTLFKTAGQLDSSAHYAQIVVTSWVQPSEIKNLLEAVTNLADIYKLRNKDSAIKYIELGHALKDSMLSTKNDREIQNIGFASQLEQEKQAAEQVKYKARTRLYATIAGLLVLLLLTSILWKNYKQQQRANLKTEQAYNELKATQAHLIQSEKMASLGELTAGIAHEIQNPLNFVTNFSDLNAELVDELMEERHKEQDTRDEKMEDQILNSIKENEQKINHHGKRAGAIVKNMLQHSRTSSGQKELTDINILTDEYLRLAWHGIRAKDKNFDAITIKTDFDNSVGKINIVRQEIGRVILNLVNNAFYAVNEKTRLQSALAGYEPLVTVNTKKSSDKVRITIKDNGNGISQKVVDKIFQPFFTTKPTGQGTGLGLYLAYDIIKAHGGEIKVETKEGEGSEFIIQLPSTSDIP